MNLYAIWGSISGMEESIGRKGRIGDGRRTYLPRLPREYYQGDAVVHWTLPIDRRQTGWLTPAIHQVFREFMLHAAAREGLFCPVYCLMPDHVHLVWMGLCRDSDQRNGMSFLRSQLEAQLAPVKFQHQAHDHVLRERERGQSAFENAVSYIVENPVRAGLMEDSREGESRGAIIPGYPTLHPLQDGYWEKFWKLYLQKRHPDAAKIKRPPI
ncbi:MAG: REP element-mobilizing transposase RayT [Limisphaerales bacterium]